MILSRSFAFDFDMPLDRAGRSVRVRVAAFAMDKFEVTVGRYGR